MRNIRRSVSERRNGPGRDEALLGYADQAEDQEKKRNIGAARRVAGFRLSARHPIVFGVSRCSAKLSSNHTGKISQVLALAYLPSPDVERNERGESECFQKIWQRDDHKDDHKAGKRSAPEKPKTVARRKIL